MNPRINSRAASKYRAGRIEMHPAEFAASPTECVEGLTERVEGVSETVEDVTEAFFV